MNLMSFIDQFILKTIDFIFELYPFHRPTDDKIKKAQIIAHRGAWDNKDRIENTIPAFLPIRDHDIYAVEFDVRWSKDNKPIIHHDPTLSRIFKSEKLICDLSLKEIQAIAPSLPDLSQVIGLLGTQKHLFIEIKEPLTSQQKMILQDELKSLKPVIDFHIMSLKFDVLEGIDFYPSQSLVSIARFNIKEVFQKTLQSKWGGLTGHYCLLSKSMIKECHQAGVKVGTGFPKSSKVFYREVDREVDWIFTNDSLSLALIKKSDKLN